MDKHAYFKWKQISVAVVQEKCPELLPKAKEVETHFITLISLFEKCHKVYNGGVADDTTIDKLST